jgi:hypothetical protein
MGRVKHGWKVFLEVVSFGSPRAIVFNLVVVFVILFLMPTGELGLLPVRSLFSLAGVKWYSVGLTRAMSRLLHGDVAGAYEMNKLVFVLFVAMVSVLVVNVVKMRRNDNPRHQD